MRNCCKVMSGLNDCDEKSFNLVCEQVIASDRLHKERRLGSLAEDRLRSNLIGMVFNSSFAFIACCLLTKDLERKI